MPGKHTLAAHKKQSIAEKPDEHKSHARHPVSCATASARRGRHPMLFDQRFDRCDQRAQRLASMGDRVLLGRLHFGGRELFAGIDRTLRLIVHVLECKKMPSQTPMEGQPRMYVGEILKAFVK